jgi:hypothetical protein
VIIGGGNLGGIISSNIYRGSDAPRYYPGHSTILAFLTIFLCGGSILQRTLLQIENGKRRRGERDVWIQGLNEEQIKMLGDRRPDFTYTL